MGARCYMSPGLTLRVVRQCQRRGNVMQHEERPRLRADQKIRAGWARARLGTTQPARPTPRLASNIVAIRPFMQTP
jgi:hypothetical protein